MAGRVTLHPQPELLKGNVVGRPERQEHGCSPAGELAADPGLVHHFHLSGARPIQRVDLLGKAVQKDIEVPFRRDPKTTHLLLGDGHPGLRAHRPGERKHRGRRQAERAEPVQVRDGTNRAEPAGHRRRGPAPERRQQRSDGGAGAHTDGYQEPEGARNCKTKRHEARTAPHTGTWTPGERGRRHDGKDDGNRGLEYDPAGVGGSQQLRRSAPAHPHQHKRKRRRDHERRGPVSGLRLPARQRQHGRGHDRRTQQYDAAEREGHRTGEPEHGRIDEFGSPEQPIQGQQSRPGPEQGDRVRQVGPRDAERQGKPRHRGQDGHDPRPPAPLLGAPRVPCGFLDRDAQQGLVRPAEVEYARSGRPVRAGDADPFPPFVRGSATRSRPGPRRRSQAGRSG